MRISDIKDGTITLENCVYVQQEVEERYEIKEGDLLIALSGATTGKMGVYQNSDKAYLNQRVGNLRVLSKEIILPEYRNLFMRSNVNKILSLAYGGAQPNISGSVITDFDFPLPPLEEQQRIVNEIDKWFALIDIIEQGKTDLQITIKQAKSKILDLAVHGKLIAQDPADEHAIELLKRINPGFTPCDNAHYPQLPKGWQLALMADICSLVDGERLQDIEYQYLDVKYLRGERGTKTMNSGKIVSKNTLMILVDGENSGEVFRAPIDGYQGSTFKQLSISAEMNEEYVLQVINLHRKSLRENKVGSAIPHLNKKMFREIVVPVPPYAEQQRIVDAINDINKQICVIAESL